MYETCIMEDRYASACSAHVAEQTVVAEITHSVHSAVRNSSALKLRNSCKQPSTSRTGLFSWSCLDASIWGIWAIVGICILGTWTVAGAFLGILSNAVAL